MNIHKNARTSPYSRLLMARRVGAGERVVKVASDFCEQTVRKLCGAGRSAVRSHCWINAAQCDGRVRERGGGRRAAAVDLISAAAARALGISDYGITVGAPANLFTIGASCVPEAVAAHPQRKLVFFDGNVVARDGSFLPAPVPIARLVAASEGERQQGSRDTGAL